MFMAGWWCCDDITSICVRSHALWAQQTMWKLLLRVSIFWSSCTSILPIWQVFIFTDTILIFLVPLSFLVHHNWYYLPPSSITNPRLARTLFLVFHNLFSLVFVLLTLSSVMSHVWGYNLTISSVDFWECPSFLFLCQPFAIRDVKRTSINRCSFVKAMINYQNK